MPPDTDAIAAFLGGFTAGDGCFTRSGADRFRFSIGLGAADAGMCEAFARFLGVGRIHRSARRRAHYDDEVQFSVQSVRELVEVVVPAMDAHLPDSHKRVQYREWRAALLDHSTHRARRPRGCAADGCSAPAKAHGWCRHHLWVLRRE